MLNLKRNPEEVKEEVKEKETVETPAAEAAAEATSEAATGAEETKEDDSEIGCMSDKLEFIAPIDNELKRDITPYTKEDGTTDKKDTAFICGYAFKALVDMDVPDCGTTERFKKVAMDFADINGVKHVKAGEVFYLTPFETGNMLTEKRFNLKVTGGAPEHACTLAVSKKNTVGATQATTAEPVPRVVLRLAGKGSMKDMDRITAIKAITKLQEDGTQKKVGEVQPGFEKWAPLAATTTRTTGGTRPAGVGRKSEGTKAPKWDTTAKQFQELLRAKGKNA